MRSVTVLIAVAAIAGMLSLGAQTTPSTPAAQSKAHHEMPRPTNLQVLPKDISNKDLIATMRGFSAALGVECSFCHAENPQTHRIDFASDANPHKNTARIMIRMLNEINTKYLATADQDAPVKSATCGTCHRGNALPPPFETGKRESHGE